MRYAISRLVIFGVGLIGGSLALSLKQAGAVGTVVGVDRCAGNLEQAQTLGIVDVVAGNTGEALAGADIVVLAVPVGQMAAVMQDIAPWLEPGTIVTDAGSTKQDVVALMQCHLAGHLSRCVPAHPIAGAELSGAGAARADLYLNKKIVITPLPASDPVAVARVADMWQCCGAQTRTMSASDHDAIFAAVSHLPHLLAYSLVNMIAQRTNAEQLFSFAAGGFRDFTRIAGSSPEMWRDIAIANRPAILDELQAFQTELEQLQAALRDQDAVALMQLFSRAQQSRLEWLSQHPPD
ncbi:MAG TPA: prephenate dehydrogenase/arogenate dehydrogenase family protein [Burkholderiales bacterium]|nr:prephenate dehydrogenase/arogenate dehydrogenase family protein [Burkholderiales bacterium]